jgi:hypothetical protein
MFGNIYPPAPVPCPRCREQPNVVTYVYFDTVALFCHRCEYAWHVDKTVYPELASVLPAAVDTRE